MTTYSVKKAFNDPRRQEFIEKDAKISKEDYNFYCENGYSNFVTATGLVPKIKQSVEELLIDIKDSTTFLAKETLGKLILDLQLMSKNLVEETEITKIEEPKIEEPKIEVKLNGKK